ncbi:hypothetical protein F511_34933 [Dorcoceras hygrometricum]|uniref:Uncharacterized protein n=1 Tax=Dorcoceras hygrometricum TaxID=472368 RepID=A0A2Z7B5X0_9LAMI|nr:hypothetical protein F511_34933 [Dorcoceras hygrometricum]
MVSIGRVRTLADEPLDISRWSEANKMKRRRAEDSADGLALMTSSVTSSYSADGLREQSQESAAIAKRCRLHKLIRQRFALTLKIPQEEFALLTSRKIQSQATVDPVATQRFPDAVFEYPDARR